MRRPVALALALILAAAVSACQSKGTHRPNDLRSELALPDISGETFDPAQLQGKRVLVNVWSPSCSSCVHEMPALQAAVDATPGAALILVAIDGRPEKAEHTARSRGIRAPVLMGDSLLAGRLRVRQVPTTFVLGKDGRTERVLIGARSQEGFERALRGP